MIFDETTEPLIRYQIDNLQETCKSFATGQVGKIIDYLDGGAYAQILEMMAERFATSVVSSEDGTGKTVYHQLKTKGAAKAAIKFKLFEVIITKLFNRIVSRKASLTRDTEFKFINETGKEDNKFKLDIEKARLEGQFDLMLARVDELSCATGSAALLTQVLGNKFNYQPIPLDKLWVGFADKINDNGKDRPTNNLNLEEATVVIVRLAEDSFAAYYPRSTDYPDGRFVTYKSSDWHAVPAVNSKESVETQAVEFKKEGTDEIANPLTWHQNKKQVYTTPEIPITPWIGTTTKVGTAIFPFTNDLWLQSKEIDLSTSRIQSNVMKSSKGLWVLTQNHDASPMVSENLDEGIARLGHGQSLIGTSIPASNSQIASDITSAAMLITAEADHVPAHEISIAKDAQAPSGLALQQLNQPATLHRREREKLNQHHMNHIFEVEMALASMTTSKDIGEGITQIWTVNDPVFNSSRVDELNAIQIEKNMGLLDVAAALMKSEPDVYKTREAAQAYLDELVPPPAAPVGLDRFAARQAQ